jgi:GTPase
MFVDKALITLVAGEGGKGLIAFRREKYNPRGGPSGGRGGDGANIWFEADQSMATLMDFRYKTLYRAPRGVHGGPNDRTGHNGEDLTIRVPVGTVIRDAITGELISDLTGHGERVLAARCGRGGRGNASFATPTRRAPDFAEDGHPGEEKTVELELKLIADVGLVGFPNSGKSTLLSRISDAHPKIADYPFTTLTPNLGVVRSDTESFVVADIPGLIEGAHEGRGLGLDFLRHIERTLILVFLIDVSSPDPAGQYEILSRELEDYSKELLRKPRCLVFSKLDLQPEGDPLPRIGDDSLFLHAGISAVTGRGLQELLRALTVQVLAARRTRMQEKEESVPPFEPVRE